MEIVSVVSKWGNSSGIRMPKVILKKADVKLNDKLFFDVDAKGRIILTKVPAPKAGTLEYLFNEYEDGAFKSEIIDLGDSVGNEQW